MWTNTFKTAVLLGALGGLIVVLVGWLGGGSSTALFLGLGLALLTVGGSYWFSDKLALRSARAQVITPEQAPELYAIVQRLAQRADLPMPTVAISPSDQPNAFATGRNPRHAVVCVTQGLLATMPKDEIESVLAHEMMHVRHRDILIGSVAAAVATVISFIANWLMWAAMWGGRDDDDGPGAIGLLLASLLAPIAAGLLQMALSRTREYDADRGAAELLGTGQTLATALQRIEGLAHQRPMAVNPAQASAWIHNPLAEAPRRRRGPNFARLFSTHPPTEDRVARLLAMH